MYKEQVDMTRLPHHVAIIMDGNGRWAQARNLERTYGHQEGVERVRDIMTASVNLGIDYLTLYTFSTENWNRPEAEVAALMSLLLKHMEEEIFMKNNVRFRALGGLELLPPRVQTRLQECMDRTAGNTKMTMNVMLSYSSRWELTETMKQMARDVKAGLLQPEDITEDFISSRLLTNFMPDPDLLIRTGGELRISNYLLWQSAYSEFYFTETYWPDFNEECLQQAIIDYQSRQRRFGETGEQVEEEGKKE